MKEKITLLSTPQTYFTRYPISSKVLNSNLRRDGRFEIHNVDDISLICYGKAVKALEDKYKPILNKIDTPYSHYARIWAGGTPISRFSIFYTYTGAFDEYILSKIPTRDILCTAYTILDFRLVKTLLNDNRRVMLGGSSTFIYDPEMIRKFMLEMGVDREKVENNLIVVRGYVDLTTDLYSIYKNWKDYKITENDFSTIWDCIEDNLTEKVNIYNSLFHTGLNALLTSKCWWGKCKFCTYTCFPKHDLTEGVPVEKIVRYFKKISKSYKSNNIFFNDSYLVNNDYNKQLFKRLTEEGFTKSLYTGVLLLKRPDYIDFLNENNVTSMLIGVETTIDSSLKFINKGYTRKDIFEMVDMLKKRLNKNTVPDFLLMCDIPLDAPNRKDAIRQIREGYKILLDIREDLASAGIGNGEGCRYALAPLRHFPRTDLADGKLLRIESFDRKINDLIGIVPMYKYLGKVLDIDISDIENAKCLSEPIMRYLPNGEPLESDANFLDKDTIVELGTWRNGNNKGNNI